MPKKLPTSEEHHEELVKGLSQQMDEILKSSKQPIYLYLDDNHKACNTKFATLLGYKSPEEWAKVQGSLDPFVAKQSHEIVASSYWKAMDDYAASNVQATLKKKDGSTFDATFIIVPMSYQGHLFAVHFITNVAK
jgi:PAS domain-containing protein